MKEEQSTQHKSIPLHLRELSQLFDSLDPSPFYDKDLDPDAEEYIVDSLRELGSPPAPVLEIHLDHPNKIAGADELLRRAIHKHFARRSQTFREELRQLIRRGWISLIIGTCFLVTFFLVAQLVAKMLGNGQWARLVRESLVIGGWVAMWRPLEIFLYDWWPIMGKRRLYDRLSRVEVQIVPQNGTDDG